MVQSASRAFVIRHAALYSKLNTLDNALNDILQLITASGTKYDMQHLSKIAEGESSPEERRNAADRLLELGEQLTQTMLKVDGVESAGYTIVRNKRKKCVGKLLALTETVESMRAKLKPPS